MNTSTVHHADANHRLYLEIDFRDGSTKLLERHESEHATPAWIWNFHGVLLRLPSSFSQFAFEVLCEELAPHVGRVVAGYSAEWDGNNTVGKLSDAAREACDEIDRVVDAFEPDVEVWELDAYLDPVVRLVRATASGDNHYKIDLGGHDLRIYPSTGDATIERFARRIRAAIDQDGEYIVNGDVGEYLRDLRSRAA